MKDKIVLKIDSRVFKQVYSGRVSKQVWDHVRDQAGQVWDQVSRQVRGQVMPQLEKEISDERQD